MGRNAKFYKSQKDKKKRSSSQSGNEDRLSRHGDNIRKVTIKTSGPDRQISKEEVEEQEDQPMAQVQSTQKISKADKLKSKLWKDLEAKRSEEGKKKYATPKEAGIDYIKQWEKRGR